MVTLLKKDQWKIWLSVTTYVYQWNVLDLHHIIDMLFEKSTVKSLLIAKKLYLSNFD